MSHVSFAYLYGGNVYRDEQSYEQGDTLGTYNIIDDGETKHILTSMIGGKIYKSLWIWDDEDVVKSKDFGIIPLLTD